MNSRERELKVCLQNHIDLVIYIAILLDLFFLKSAHTYISVIMFFMLCCVY